MKLELITHPNELLQTKLTEEWDFETSLMWHLLDDDYHKQMQKWLMFLRKFNFFISN